MKVRVNPPWLCGSHHFWYINVFKMQAMKSYRHQRKLSVENKLVMKFGRVKVNVSKGSLNNEHIVKICKRWRACEALTAVWNLLNNQSNLLTLLFNYQIVLNLGIHFRCNIPKFVMYWRKEGNINIWFFYYNSQMSSM